MAKVIHLQKLECNQTSELHTDECYLIVDIDDVEQGRFRMQLSAGQTWYLNESYSFEDKVEVKLFDEDYLDSDDLLGTVSLSTEPTNGTISVPFELNAAQYRLWYEIVNEDNKLWIWDGGRKRTRVNRPTIHFPPTPSRPNITVNTPTHTPTPTPGG